MLFYFKKASFKIKTRNQTLFTFYSFKRHRDNKRQTVTLARILVKSCFNGYICSIVSLFKTKF